jgi:serine/threonine-protein kinase
MMRDNANPLVLIRTARFLAVLALLSGIVALTGMHAPRAAANQFSDDEQKIANLLPAGFQPSLCKTASDPIPPLDAVASLQCTGSAAGGPTTGRFTLWPDAETMNDQFQTQAVGSALWAPSPCPGIGASPANWNYTETSDQVAGQLLCGSFQGAPNIEWTRTSQLLTLDVGGAPDIESLFHWWGGSGNPGGAPITGVLA